MSEENKDQLVHAVPQPGRRWKWTKNKRKAVALVVEGRTDKHIAKVLGKHRNTIRNWRQTHEFNVACVQEARAYVNRMRYKRAHETGIIIDNLAGQIGTRLKHMSEIRPEEIQGLDLNHLQLVLREYREFRLTERHDFGDDIQRVDARFHIGFAGGAALAGGEDGQPVAIASQSFKALLEAHVEAAPERKLMSTVDASQALVEATRKVLLNTEVLDAIQQEEEDAKER